MTGALHSKLNSIPYTWYGDHSYPVLPTHSHCTLSLSKVLPVYHLLMSATSWSSNQAHSNSRLNWIHNHLPIDSPVCRIETWSIGLVLNWLHYDHWIHHLGITTSAASPQSTRLECDTGWVCVRGSLLAGWLHVVCWHLDDVTHTLLQPDTQLTSAEIGLVGEFDVLQQEFEMELLAHVILKYLNNIP